MIKEHERYRQHSRSSCLSCFSLLAVAVGTIAIIHVFYPKRYISFKNVFDFARSKYLLSDGEKETSSSQDALFDTASFTADHKYKTESVFLDIKAGLDNCIVHAILDGNPHSQPLFLLHGSKFSSKTWDKSDTVNALLKSGSYFIARIDLPDHGSSETCRIPNGQYLNHVFKVLIESHVSNNNLKKPVVVVVSYSSSFILEYLLEINTNLQSVGLSGVIWVAPANPIRNQFELVFKLFPDVKHLFVQGSHDEIGSAVLNVLNELEEKGKLKIRHKYDIATVEGSGHACYLDNPESFNKVVVNWMKERFA